MEHNTKVSYGENIYYCSGFEPTGYEVTKSWYEEVSSYDFERAQFTEEAGHFTAVVWAASRRIGLGVGRSAKGNYYVVAYYDPPGNVPGGFASNVKPSKKQEINVRQSKVAGTIVGRGWTCKSCCATICCRSVFDEFQTTCLDAHNEYRLRHDSPKMKLNQKMCQEAQNWAEVGYFILNSLILFSYVRDEAIHVCTTINETSISWERSLFFENTCL